VRGRELLEVDRGNELYNGWNERIYHPYSQKDFVSIILRLIIVRVYYMYTDRGMYKWRRIEI
jgi:histone acetyltransferase (RNA polymerase elongator complex component)